MSQIISIKHLTEPASATVEDTERWAVVDLLTRVIWYVERGDTPESTCSTVAASVAGYEARFVPTSYEIEPGQRAYLVYDASEMLDLTEKLEELWTKAPFLGCYRPLLH